jgi:NTE family protein
MAADADSPTPPPGAEAGASSRRRGIGLCLSGGGFRATLFHAGAIQRLFELGVTARPDFDTVASVSGGSLTSAQWAVAAAQSQAEGRSLDFARDVVRPLRTLASRDIRTGALAQKYLLPWNWFRGAFAVDAMVSKFEGAFGKGTLDLLPERPRFVFCGTDMAFGANFVFERERVGSYLAGYADPRGFSLAQAVAASACFPPLFGPLRIHEPQRFKGGRAPGVGALERREILSDLRVTDGGVYDNLALEPVWKDHRVVLVSDAGGLMDAEADKNLFWRIKRYQSIQDTQGRSVRKRFLISGYTSGTIGGAYIGVGSAPERYAACRESGYSTQGPKDGRTGGGREAGSYGKAFAMDVIRNIRTDLDAFSEVEQGVLMNHGYALIDAAIRTHVPEWIGAEGAGVAPFAWPAPEFAPPAMGEDELRRRLLGSEKRKLTGRG